MLFNSPPLNIPQLPILPPFNLCQQNPQPQKQHLEKQQTQGEEKYQEVGFISLTLNKSVLLPQIQNLSVEFFNLIVYNQEHMNNQSAKDLDQDEDMKKIQDIIDEMSCIKDFGVSYVLAKSIEVPCIKNNADFIAVLFDEHIECVEEMINWMLMPKFLIKKRKIKIKVDAYPLRCKQFMKDNSSFYEQLYISARNNRLPFEVWFKFLSKQFLDPETLYTSLGYFSEIMIPFAKYEFSESLYLTQSVDLSKKTEQNLSYGIMQIISQPLFQQILSHCHYDIIYNFITTAILVSIQDPNDYERSQNWMLKILTYSQLKNIFLKFPPINIAQNEAIIQFSDLLENVSRTLKEILQNIDPGNTLSHRISSLIIIFLKSNIVEYAIKQISSSKFCLRGISKSPSLNGSTDLVLNQKSPVMEENQLFASQQIKTVNQNEKAEEGEEIFTDTEEEDLVEILFKILYEFVEIYDKLPQFSAFSESKSNSLMLPESSSYLSKTQINSQQRIAEYRELLNEYQRQIQYLLDNLFLFNKIGYNGSSQSPGKSIPFSSGQNIKPITFMRKSYFTLIYNCLSMLKNQYKDPLEQQKSPTTQKQKIRRKSTCTKTFQFDISKLKVIESIQKYLSENRWNNIIHHLLEKICHLLIMNSYQYLKSNIEKDKNKKLTDSFLAFLIENFTQRDYIFLNTFKFTSQGNLHSLYTIAKDLAYTLNSTNQLVLLINQFQPWKKFIMTDLKKYEEKTYPKGTMPENWEDEEAKGKSYDANGLKVDEADSIRKLIQNITVTKKWPSRNPTQSISKSLIQRKSGQVNKSSYNQVPKSQFSQHFNRQTSREQSSKISQVQPESIANELDLSEISEQGNYNRMYSSDIRVNVNVKKPKQKTEKKKEGENANVGLKPETIQSSIYP